VPTDVVVFVAVLVVVAVVIGLPAAVIGVCRSVRHRRHLRGIDVDQPVTIHVTPSVRRHRRCRLVWGGGRHVG
jgi:hypothetical protein